MVTPDEADEVWYWPQHVLQRWLCVMSSEQLYKTSRLTFEQEDVYYTYTDGRI